MPALHPALAQAVAARELVAAIVAKRCAVCDVAKKVDLSAPPRKGWIRSVCGVCGNWLGDRPAGGKGETKITTESTE